MKKKIFILVTVIILLIAMSSTAFALYYPDSFYDAISWIYSYSATYTTSYNCLGYATGSMTWEWPSVWGSVATQAEVDSYLDGLGYDPTTSHTAAWIISYGPSSNNITHFSKVTGTSWCRAKWGSLERFNHGDHSPYYSDSDYGLLRRMYYKP
jgi:hypothetical protein